MTSPRSDVAADLIGELVNVRMQVVVQFESGDEVSISSPILRRNDLTDSAVLAFLTLQLKEQMQLIKQKLKLRRQSHADFDALLPPETPTPAAPEGDF